MGSNPLINQHYADHHILGLKLHAATGSLYEAIISILIFFYKRVIPNGIFSQQFKKSRFILYYHPNMAIQRLFY